MRPDKLTVSQLEELGCRKWKDTTYPTYLLPPNILEQADSETPLHSTDGEIIFLKDLPVKADGSLEMETVSGLTAYGVKARGGSLEKYHLPDWMHPCVPELLFKSVWEVEKILNSPIDKMDDLNDKLDAVEVCSVVRSLEHLKEKGYLSGIENSRSKDV